MSIEILAGAVAFLALIVTWVVAPHGPKADAPVAHATSAVR
jgi:hypothetical protein